MKRTAHAGKSPRIRIVAPTAALATGLVTPLAWAGPGDLDPAFGNAGRVSGLPNLSGPAWSLDTTGDDILFGGFDEYCYYFCDYTGFTSRLDLDGRQDAAFAAAKLQDTDVRDVLMQPDGKAVAVGTNHTSGGVPVVFRLNADGALDPSFGNGGVVQLATLSATFARGTSLVLEPDGRITVAGLLGDKLMVTRLLGNGATDTGFGTNGSFVWDRAVAMDRRPQLVQVSAGYRVLVHVRRAGSGGSAVSDCRILALTASGAPDAAFGTGGVSGDVVVPTEKGSVCAAMGVQQDGRVVVGGSVFADTSGAFAARLLSTGALDPLFLADAVPAAMSEVTALAVGGNDSIALAGRDQSGVPGALVVRLQSDGLLDVVFGRGGSTLFDIESDVNAWPTVYDMQVRPDGAIVMAGGFWGAWPARPFVARLLGNSSGGGPGIADIVEDSRVAREADGSVSFNVRRIGGRSGAVNVTYQAGLATDVDEPFMATAGADFAPIQGQLSWADGDDSDRVVTVPIVQDSGPLERPEEFAVRLADPSGGLGLGTRAARITIVGDAFPAGSISLETKGVVLERDSPIEVLVSREDYGAGAVWVDLSVGGSAINGQDYSLPAETLRLSWGDGEFGTKRILIPLINDRRKEREETVIVSLAGVTGGALIGARSSATVTILDDDDDAGSGGSGSSGAVFLLLSSLAGLLRLRRRSAA